MDGPSRVDGTGANLLHELERILESDPLIDEFGFIHPTQFTSLDADDSKLQNLEFWSRDHKVGISTEILMPLYGQAKRSFFDAMGRYRMRRDLASDRGNEDSVGYSSVSHDGSESDVMKHSKALLLLSSDFGTAWNSRKLIASKDILSIYTDELRLSELILSYSHKSEQAWSHRRWVIKLIAGKISTLEEIIRKESELVEKIAERSKMNYRAWNHRGWLVSYMSKEQVFYELKKSKSWAGLHVADNSSFHYQRRLMMRILEDCCLKDGIVSHDYPFPVSQLWKEVLDWNATLIKRYIGREGLWLHRRFLSFCWLRHFTTDLLSGNSNYNTGMTNGPSYILDELDLVSSCLVIPDHDFDDFQMQAMHSTTYILWLTKQLPKSLGLELQEKLAARGMNALLCKFCPSSSFYSVSSSADRLEVTKSGEGER